VPECARYCRRENVRVLRDPQIISGFIYEEPVDEIPGFTHCGEALCCRGHARSTHMHSGFEFLYLSRGTCHWQVAGKTFRQGMGDMFIACPHEAHGTGPKPNPENQHLWLGLRLEKLGADGARLAREIRGGNIRLLSGCQEAEPLLRAIVGQVVELRPRRAEVIVALLHAFVALVAQRVSLAGSKSEAVLSPPLLPYSFAVQKAVAYMRQNLDRRIPLQDLAAMATARNVPHFCTQFRREVGLPPASYHMQLRLESARESLCQPSAVITTVALQFGFSSSQHFSTLFLRAYGVTPRQWRIRNEHRNQIGRPTTLPGRARLD
jgi:AraC-like DNA-binding protein